MIGFRGKWWMTGGACVALAAAISPAFGAASDLLRFRASTPVSLGNLGSISSFTPSIHDPRLSSAYAKAALNSSAKGFRFTPTSGSMSGRRSITVLVRAVGSLGGTERAAPSVGIAPVAFNLDASHGWRKFALPESVGHKPLDPVVFDLPAARGFSLDKSRSRISTDVLFDAKRDVGTAEQTLAGERKVSVNVASSYSLTRNLNVTAGVRYSGPDNRLAPITDQRQDNQAVYLGTVFKF